MSASDDGSAWCPYPRGAGLIGFSQIEPEHKRQKMNTCKTCKHWRDSYEPMVLPFAVRQCKHPSLTFCERPVESNGFRVADMAALVTAEDFGCVRHEAESAQ